MEKAILAMMLVFLLAAYGCESGETIVKNVSPEQNQTQPVTPVNETPAGTNETETLNPEEEQNFPSPYTLDQLGSFIKDMDYLLGDNAPSTDVILVTNVKTYLIYKGIETGSAKLTSDMENYRRDSFIVVGSPCDNTAAADLFRKEIAEKGSCKIFPEGEGVMKLKAVSNNNFMLYVGGNTNAETKKAMAVLQYFSNYTLSGTEARITGTAETPVVAVVG